MYDLLAHIPQKRFSYAVVLLAVEKRIDLQIFTQLLREGNVPGIVESGFAEDQDGVFVLQFNELCVNQPPELRSSFLAWNQGAYLFYINLAYRATPVNPKDLGTKLRSLGCNHRSNGEGALVYLSVCTSNSQRTRGRRGRARVFVGSGQVG